jgi:hypothetical protein
MLAIDLKERILTFIEKIYAKLANNKYVSIYLNSKKHKYEKNNIDYDIIYIVNLNFQFIINTYLRNAIIYIK